MSFKKYLFGLLAVFTTVIASAQKYYEVDFQINSSEFRANTPYLLSSNYGLTTFLTNNGTTYLTEHTNTNPLDEHAVVKFVPANETTDEGVALYYIQFESGDYIADQEMWNDYDSSDMKQDWMDEWEPAPYMSTTNSRTLAAKWTVLPAETLQKFAEGEPGYLWNWRTWTGGGIWENNQYVPYPNAFVIMRDKLSSPNPQLVDYGTIGPVYLETQGDYTFFAKWGNNSWFLCEANEIDAATILIRWVEETLPFGIEGITSKVGTTLGTYKEASTHALVEAFEAYEVWYFNSFDDTEAVAILENLKTAYAQLERNGVTDGHYYIKSSKETYSAYAYEVESYLYTQTMYELPQNEAGEVTVNKDTKPFVWKVTGTAEGVTFQNLATSNYVQFTTNYPFIMGTEPQTFQLHYGENAFDGLVYIYTTYSNGSESCAWNIYAGYADMYGYPVGNWRDRNDPGNYWAFIPVEDIDFEESVDPEEPETPETPETPEVPEEEVDTEKLFVHLKGGAVEAYPVEIVQTVEQDGTAVNIVLMDNTVKTYSQADVDSVSNCAPQEMPYFTSLKFNNKYNDQVFTDVEATVTTDSIYATIGAIGKWLTPSFQLSDERAKAWVKGVEQKSKQGRVNFDGDVVYTVGYDNWKQYAYQKIKDEVWSEGSTGEPICEAIPLSVDQLSTNAPSNRESSEGLAMMLDNNTETYFHSTWGDNGTYEKLPLDQFPYIDIELEEAVNAFVFGYSTRFDVDNRFPQAFNVKVSNDGTNWTNVADYGANEGVPQGGIGQTYESPAIRLDASYKYIRLTMTQTNYKNYLCLSELWLKKVVSEGTYEEPTLISPAEYAFTTQPFGRKVRVSIDWLTDTAAVPAVYITTDEGILPPDKENYLDATIRIDGAGVFPDFEDRVKIRGRGNTSWAGQNGKSPYRLKFDSSKKPFGLTKGKSWVLLANRQTGSMLSNAVAMKIASMVETAGANRIIPVELYINDEYRGSYNFTQHVGLSNNSIDLDDESNAVLLELDSYWDEDYKFKTPYYDLPTNVKDPDLAEDYADPDAQLSLIENDFNNFENILSRSTDEYANYIDVEMLARFLMVNELVMNCELGHPKSTFLYKEDLKALHSRYVFGPVWDFDWAFGYEKNGNYCTYTPTADFFSVMVSGRGKTFFNDLRYNSEAVARAYYKVWTDFMENHYEELLDYVETYYQYAQPSFVNNASKWSDGRNYMVVKNNTINWLKQRAKHIYDNLDAYDVSSPMDHNVGDVNLDGYITVADVVCIINNLFGQDNETFDFDQADLDLNGAISINDAVHAIALVMNQPEWSSSAMALPKAAATLKMQQCQMGLGEQTYCPLALQVDTEDYVALQFDLQLPEKVTLQDIDLSENFNGHKVVYQQMAEGKYRIVVYSDNGKVLPAGTHELHLALQASQALPETKRIVSTFAALLTNKVGEDNRLAAHSAQFDVTPTGIHNIDATTVIRGGDMLYVESVTAQTLPIYSVDGRCIKTVNIQAGKNTIALPNGVYVVNNTKIMICK